MGLYSCCDVTNPAPETELLYGHRIGGMHGEAAAVGCCCSACCILRTTRVMACHGGIDVQEKHSCSPSSRTCVKLPAASRQPAMVCDDDRLLPVTGYTHLTGGYDGGQAQYNRVPYGE